MPKTTTKKRTFAGEKKKKYSVDAVFISYMIVVAAILLCGASMVLHRSQVNSVMNTETYQAVFLTNGQVYFGKLDGLTHRSLVLTDVYYVQETPADTEQAPQQDAQQTQPEQQNTQENAEQTQFAVVRLGNELHQPENQMVINRDQVLFWENLRSDSQVISAIEQQKQGE